MLQAKNRQEIKLLQIIKQENMNVSYCIFFGNVTKINMNSFLFQASKFLTTSNLNFLLNLLLIVCDIFLLTSLFFPSIVQNKKISWINCSSALEFWKPSLFSLLKLASSLLQALGKRFCSSGLSFSPCRICQVWRAMSPADTCFV